MPKLYEILGWKVYFWIFEGNPLEPLHVHIAKRPHKNATKIWINEKNSFRLSLRKREPFFHIYDRIDV